MIGQTLGHFRILEKIGSGGMGEVYRAHDERLERDVAVKVLPLGALGDEAARKRFRKEALALAMLNHPHIGTVYDFDTQAGVDFLVMEYIPGLTLKNKLAAGAMVEKEAVALGAQIASALEEAHEHNVVHRDLKPGNIVITPKGQAKILDFGLAKLLRPVSAVTATQSLSETQEAVGTLPYMAPEQLRGEKADARTDIYAAGAVLYEMATGQRPFSQTLGPQLTDAILHQTPAPPSALNRRLSPALESIILKALDKEPDHRYQSAKELRVDLDRLSKPTPLEPIRPAARWRVLSRWQMSAITAALALLVLVAALSVWHLRGRGPRPGAAAGHKAVAVLYFRNLSQDPSLNWLDGGLTEMLTTNLAQVQGIDVISTERIMAALQRSAKKDATALDQRTALEVARNAGADAFVTGAVLRVGPTRLRLDVNVQDTTAGQILFSDKLEGEDVNSVFGLVDSLTLRIAERFVPAAKLPEKAPAIEEAATANLEAYRHYQVGRDYAIRFLVDEAIRELEEALRLDPQFARAALNLSGLYSIQGDLRKSQEVLRSVSGMLSRLSRKDYLLYQSRMANLARDPEAQVKALQSLLAEFPRESLQRSRLAQTLAMLNQSDDAITLLREGLLLDPKNELLWNQMCYSQAFAGNLAGALEADDHYMALRPGDPNPWDARGDAFYRLHRDDEAVEAFRKVLELKPDFAGASTWVKLDAAYAEQEKFALAGAALQEYGRQTNAVGRSYLPVFEALLQEDRGDLSGARQSYRRAIGQLGRAGQTEAAGDTLLALARISVLEGEGGAALAFARQLHLEGEEYRAIAWLEAAAGNPAAAERSIQQFAAMHPGVGLSFLEVIRADAQTHAALARDDGNGVLAVAGRLPDLQYSWLLFAKGRAHLLLRDYARAGQELGRAIFVARNSGAYSGLRTRSPTRDGLCHFYLGQVYEATGKRAEATNEYREFLSHFENSRTRIPQLVEARAALKRLQ